MQGIFMLASSSDLYEIATMGILVIPKGQVHTN